MSFQASAELQLARSRVKTVVTYARAIVRYIVLRARASSALILAKLKRCHIAKQIETQQ